MKKYAKETGRHPMIGIMGADSRARRVDISARGCNVYDAKSPQSRPLAHWTERDIYTYIHFTGLNICDIYDKGYNRTGCVFCMFGLELEQKNTGTNRFIRLRETHPKLYAYVMDKLGAREVLDFMGVPYA